MEKITCIQQYVIDNLIENEILSTNSLLSAVSKVCSEEQFNNILSILIETPIPCTNISELEHKEDLARISIFIPEKTSTDAKIKIIKILQKQFNFSLSQLKNMQIVAQESLIYYLRLLCKQRQMKLQKNQNLIM